MKRVSVEFQVLQRYRFLFIRCRKHRSFLEE